LLSQSQQLVTCNALHDVQSRMCRLLLQARDRTGSNILPLTQDYLGQMLGVQRTTVTSVDRKLQMAGWVRQRRGRIELLDIVALTNAACDCYPVTEKYFSQVFPPLEVRAISAVAI
jgi:CRP-like cAMP-binding protein